MGVKHDPLAAKQTSASSVEIPTSTLEAHLAAVSRYIENSTAGNTQRLQASCRKLKELAQPVTRVAEADSFLERLKSPEWQEFLSQTKTPMESPGSTTTSMIEHLDIAPWNQRSDNLAHSPWKPL